MSRFGKRTAILILALLAFMPTLLYAYLGSFSRLYVDDYTRIGLPLDIGIWETMLYLREIWNGDYTNFLFQGLLAPLGSRVTSVFPLVLILVTLLGYSWLINTILAWMKCSAHRRLTSIAFASLVVAAVINGFSDLEAIFWYTAAVEYFLPPAFLLLGIAISVETTRRLRGSFQLMLAAAATAVISFFIAGFSELHLVFQLSLVALIAVYVFIFHRCSKRKSYQILALAACLGTFASLPVQLSSPGFAFRSSLPEDFGYLMNPVRDLPLLLSRTLNEVMKYLGNEDGFAGFMLIASAGLFVTLSADIRVSSDLQLRRVTAGRSPVAFGLILQLFFVPILWSHHSDNLQVLGKFSYPFMIVIVINLFTIFILLALLFRHRQLEEWFTSRNRLEVYCSGVLLVVCVLFMMTQVRDTHYKAATYLFVTTVAALLMLAGQLTLVIDSPRLNDLFQISICCSASAIITFAALIAVKLWGAGFVLDRKIIAPIFLQMGSGLFCGVTLGALIHSACSRTDADAVWLRWLRLLCLLATVTIAVGILVRPASWISYVQESAEIIDSSEQEIIRLRNEGDPEVYTKSFVFAKRHNATRFPPQYITEPLVWGHKLFYDLEYEWPYNPYVQDVSRIEHDDS